MGIVLWGKTKYKQDNFELCNLEVKMIFELCNLVAKTDFWIMQKLTIKLLKSKKHFFL